MELHWAITDIDWSAKPNWSRAILFTNTPCYITGFKTSKYPLPTIKWGISRGAYTRCVPHWTVGRATPKQQNEAGDTYIHTIDFPGMGTDRGYAFIFTATIASQLSMSVSPIFRHINGGGTTTAITIFPIGPGALCDVGAGTWPCPFHFMNINESPPDYETSMLWDERTGGNFPLNGKGDLYQMPPLSSPQKYHFIDQLRVYAICKKDHGAIWGCINPQESYVPQLKIPGMPYFYGSASMMPATWGQWQSFIDLWDKNPFTNQDWWYPDIDNMQVGLQLQRPCFSGVRIYTYCTQLYLYIRYWN